MGFRIAVIELNGQKMVVDSFTAMIHNAEISRNTELLSVLVHRREVHDDGPCTCA